MTLIDQPTLTLSTQMPPHDVEAEMCALASLMLCGEDRKLFSRIRALLHKDAFFQVDHQIIFEVITHLADQGEGDGLDFVLVRAELERRQLLEEVGGIQYLAKIAHAVPSYLHGPHYAKLVRDAFVRRQLIAASDDLARSAYAPLGDTPSSLAMKAAAKLTDIGAAGQTHDIETGEDLAAKFIDSRDSTRVRIIPTGISDLDEKIGGVRKGRFTIVGAKASMGKSTLLRQILLNLAMRGVKVGLVAIEEDDDKIAANILSNLSGVENNKIIERKPLTQEENKALMDAVAKLGTLPLHVCDTAFNLSDISATMHRLALEHECEVIGVDHLHLIDGEIAKGGQVNRNQEVSGISRHLKMLFRKLNVAGVVAAQLNRGGDATQAQNRRPVLRDLRDSGTLEQDGDLIMLLHREDWYRYSEPNYVNTGIVETLVAKNKDGSPAVVSLDFAGAYQRVKNLPLATKQRLSHVSPEVDVFA
ncbi:MAG TPA: replicative DNA helicase [Tepidisphaeraceae bacterium]|jgi:replicative DNA helicase